MQSFLSEKLDTLIYLCLPYFFIYFSVIAAVVQSSLVKILSIDQDHHRHLEDY